jgi:TPR repeat protein
MSSNDGENPAPFFDNSKSPEPIISYSNSTNLQSNYLQQINEQISQNHLRSALVLLTEKPDTTDGNVLFRTGEVFEQSYGGKSVLEKAAYFYQRAVQNNHAEAAFRLGCFFQEGILFNRDKDIAHLYFEKAKELGHIESYIQLGLYYLEADPNKAKELFAFAASKNSLEARYQLGMVCFKLGQIQDSLDAFFSASKLPKAAYMYSSLYFQHNSNYDQKYDKAFELLRYAADSGYTDAQILIGEIYSLETHPKFNIELSYKYYREAAKSKNDTAVYAIDSLFSNDCLIPLAAVSNAMRLNTPFYSLNSKQLFEFKKKRFIPLKSPGESLSSQNKQQESKLIIQNRDNLNPKIFPKVIPITPLRK